MNPNTKRFIGHVVTTCLARRVELVFCNQAVLGNGNLGTFYWDEPLLVVATGGAVADWLPVLAHEFGHAQQLFVKKFKPKILSLNELFFPWLSGTIELDSPYIRKAAKAAIAIELDCERRVLRMISRFGLPIDKLRYAQLAASYVTAFKIASETRKWVRYEDPEIVRNMPASLRGLERALFLR